MQDTLSDQQLVESAKNGNLNDFEALVNRYQGIVFRFLYHFMGNHNDAEDFTQETFIHLYRKLSLYNPAQSFKTWLITMARNLAVSHYRKRSPTPIDPEIIADVVKDVVSGPEVEALIKESTREVQSALHRLSDEMREVLVMRYMLDFSIQKVAEALNIPEGTAKSRAFQARSELRAALTKVFPILGEVKEKS